MSDAARQSESTLSPRGAACWIPPLLLTAIGTVMAAWTWMAWPDPVVDAGRELYTPWRILVGEVPYRDMALFNGPLSMYINAAVFFIGGTSLRTLVIFNLIVLAGVVALTYAMARQVASRAAATIACALFLLLLAFSQYTVVGNYCWAFAYSHELTHGIALSLLSLFLLGKWAEDDRPAWALAAGVALGLVFLTKVEITVAAFGAAGAGVVAWVLCRGMTPRRARGIALGVAGIVIPPTIALMLLRLAMPWHEAARAVIGTWAYMGNREHTDLPFFSFFMGTDDWLANVLHLLRWSGYYALWLGPGVAASVLWRRQRAAAALLAVPMVVLVVRWLMDAPAQAQPGLWQFVRQADWLRFATPWPVLLLIVMIAGGVALVRHRRDAAKALTAWRVTVAAAFALAMMLKMILFARIWHYGFALAMPALLVLTAALWDGVPHVLRRLKPSIRVYHAGLCIALLLVLAVHLNVNRGRLATRTHIVGEGPDRFRADARGVSIEQARLFLAEHAAPDQTLATMPEGQMLNYLSRRAIPAPFGPLNPAVIILFGEDRILTAFRDHPPDCVALVHCDTSSYGAQWFGRDYGRQLWQWLQADYQPMQLFGSPVFNPRNEPGVLLVQRRRADAGESAQDSQGD